MINKLEVPLHDYISAKFETIYPTALDVLPPVVVNIFKLLHVQRVYHIPYTPLVLFITPRRVAVTQLLGHGDMEIITLCPLYHDITLMPIMVARNDSGILFIRIGEKTPPFALCYNTQY